MIFMSNETKLVKWEYNDDKTVKFNYSDNTSLLVLKSDFDRAFGCMVALSKEVLTKEYMHKHC